jgi:hypothetical protein
MKSLKKAMKAVQEMNSDLKDISDNKLIEGYKKAMEDYKNKGDYRIKAAVDVIKKEIDRRGLKAE